MKMCQLDISFPDFHSQPKIPPNMEIGNVGTNNGQLPMQIPIQIPMQIPMQVPMKDAEGWKKFPIDPVECKYNYPRNSSQSVLP